MQTRRSLPLWETSTKTHKAKVLLVKEENYTVECKVYVVIWKKKEIQSNRLNLPLLRCYCSDAQWCLTLCDPMDFSIPDFPVLHHLPEFAQIHVH